MPLEPICYEHSTFCPNGGHAILTFNAAAQLDDLTA
jgi:hypothetical protein